MFDKYLIVDDSLANVVEGGETTGFRFRAKLGYYRGLTLSMVEALDISVDGETVDRAAVTLDEGNGPLTMDEMATCYDRRWGFGQEVDLVVTRPGGLAPGEHALTLTEKLRISYLPFPAINTCEKTLAVA